MSPLRLLALPALLLLAAAPLVSSFGPPRPADKRLREVPAFTRLLLANSARVVLRQGSPQKVEVDASAADQQWLETEVKGSRLRIGTKDSGARPRWHQFEGPVTVYVTMPTVTALSVNASGNLRAETDVTADELDLAINGSGQMELPGVRARALETSVNGSGDVLLGGSSAHHAATISGSGSVRAGKLRSESAKVSVVGSGNAHIFATKTLDASLVGSGNVYLAGGAHVSSSTMGSGRVKQY